MDEPNISICIPAYKNTTYLKRLLDSIFIQTYKDYEVIITDDSPDDSVENFITEYSSLLPIKYFKNDPVLGTPENWNEAIRRAHGKWIKIMHDDDWFANETSLERFADLIIDNTNARFIYSRYANIENGKLKSVSEKPSSLIIFMVRKQVETLMARNIIGPPSVTIYKNEKIYYDRNLKWLVDIDFYVRYLNRTNFVYCDEVLVCIGLNDLQVTKQSSRIREVEVPEYMYVLNKYGKRILNNIKVYDSYWRLVRNFSLAKISDIRDAGYAGQVEKEVEVMMKAQQRLPIKLLQKGVSSKMFMSLSYFKFVFAKL